jgi:hypothetical protein
MRKRPGAAVLRPYKGAGVGKRFVVRNDDPKKSGPENFGAAPLSLARSFY